MNHTISFSKNALIRLKQRFPDGNVLFQLKAGGCNGFQYLFSKVQGINDDDIMEKHEHMNVFICNKSLMYLVGTKVDWVTDDMGDRFVFNNPLATSSCGCGKTFGI